MIKQTKTNKEGVFVTMSNHVEAKTEKKDNMDNIGIMLFCIYIFMSYIANGVVIPTVLNTLSLYLFLVYSMLYVFIKGKLKICSTTIWFALFTLLSLASMIYSPEKQIFGGTFYFLIVAIILLICLSQYKINQQMLEKILWAYTLSAPLMLLILMVTGKLTASADGGRLGEELFGNANIMATMMMLSALYAMWLFMYSKNGNIKNVILVVGILIDYYGMFLSGGRKYIVVPILFLYVLLLFKQDKKEKTHFIKSTIIVIEIMVCVYLLIMKVPMFYEIIGSRMESLFSFMEGDYQSADGSSKIRAQMIEIGLKRWTESPIWGYGFDSFKYYNRVTTGHFYYSHNNFVEMLYNTGLIGFVAYYWIYWKYFVVAYKSKNTISIAARAFVIAMVICMLVYEYGAINYTATGTIIMFYFAELMLRNNRKSTGLTV